MQAQDPFKYLILLNGAVHMALLIASFIVLVIGWRRHRQLGFVVLAAWAAVSTTWWVGMSMMGMLYPQIASALNISVQSAMMLTNLISGTFLSVLMLLGFGLLVFQRRAQPSPQQPDTTATVR